MFGLGVQELLLILVIVLIFFGAEKIPQLARSLGKGVSEFKKAQQDVKEEIMKDQEPAAAIVTPPDTVYAKTFIACPNCHAQIQAGSQFCPQCGVRVNHPAVCNKCQNPLQPGDKFCGNCGEKVDG